MSEPAIEVRNKQKLVTNIDACIRLIHFMRSLIENRTNQPYPLDATTPELLDLACRVVSNAASLQPSPEWFAMAGNVHHVINDVGQSLYNVATDLKIDVHLQHAARRAAELKQLAPPKSPHSSSDSEAPSPEGAGTPVAAMAAFERPAGSLSISKSDTS